MKEPSTILHGFSKKSRDEKLEIVASFIENGNDTVETLKSFHHNDPEVQEMIEEFSENAISNFHLPFSVVPNFLINGKVYMLPMVIEESSVVAAAANSAKFWFSHGGFKTEVLGTEKIGQVHFLCHDNVELLRYKFPELKESLIAGCELITENMRGRGGGILDIQLKDLTHMEPGLMQLFCTFETADAMGANFINSCLEQFSATFKEWHATQKEFNEDGLDVVMCILSNLTPNCRIRCTVETEIENFNNVIPGISGDEFVSRFYTGVRIAEVDPYRAVTHNKGILNGIDAVVLASGNDFRAVEACAHAYASSGAQYLPLSRVVIHENRFQFSLEVPLALGVVGGLTNLHPLVKLSLSLLRHPSASELMSVAAAAGLATNFSAVKSLVTTGIQKGHMKMHLFNIMKQLGVPDHLKKSVVEYFKDKKVSVYAVRSLMEQMTFNPIAEKHLKVD